MPKASKKLVSPLQIDGAFNFDELPAAIDQTPSISHGIGPKAKIISANKFRDWAQTAGTDASQDPETIERVQTLVRVSPKIPASIVSNALWRLMGQSITNGDIPKFRAFSKWQNELLSSHQQELSAVPMQESQRQFWQSFIKPKTKLSCLQGCPFIVAQAWAEHDTLFAFWQWRHHQTELEQAQALALVCGLVREGMPRGDDGGRALSVALRGSMGNAYCLENAAQELARETSRSAIDRAFEKALPFVVAANDLQSVDWMLAHGATDSPGAMARAMESLARSSLPGISIANRLLACAIDWAQCWALGLAFLSTDASGHDKLSLARRMMTEAGAPADGPASAGPNRPEPLAGAAWLVAAPFGANIQEKMKIIRTLIGKGAPAGGVKNDSAPLRLVLSNSNPPSPEIISFFREMGIIQPRDWRYFCRRASAPKNMGMSEADHFLQLGHELKAQKEAEQLHAIVAAPKKQSIHKSLKARAEPIPRQEGPRSSAKGRRL